jgi:hypothetical protein
MFLGIASSDNYIEMWGMKVKSTNAAITTFAIMAVFFGSMVKSYFKIVHSQAASNSMVHQNMIVVDEKTGIGIPKAIIIINFQEGQKQFISGQNGNVIIEFLQSNRNMLKNVEMIVKAKGYEAPEKLKLNLNSDKVSKVGLSKIDDSSKNKIMAEAVTSGTVIVVDEQYSKLPDIVENGTIGEIIEALENISEQMSYSKRTELNMLLGKKMLSAGDCDNQKWRDDIIKFLKGY